MNGGLDPEPRDIKQELCFKRSIILDNLSEGRIRGEFVEYMAWKAILTTLMIIEEEGKLSEEEIGQLKTLLDVVEPRKKWYQFWKT